MRKGLTELVFVLDMSGSMYNLTDDTIGGFNSMIAKQRELEGEALVTTVLFNTRHSMLHDRLSLESLPAMTRRDYSASGCTALLDAVGDTIKHIAKIHKYSRPEDIPEHTVFVITTDGMENASRRYSTQQVKELISHEKEKYGWEFIFLGANIDAVSTAANIGISAERSANFYADAGGLDLAFSGASDVMHSVRSCKPVSACWKSDMESDNRRKRGNNK